MHVIGSAISRVSLYSAIVSVLTLLATTALTYAQGSPTELGLSRDIWFSLRTDGQPGSGTMSDPFNGTGNRMDTKLREFLLNGETNLHLHFLPGIYETEGMRVWVALGGWKIRGAGIDVTTFKLVNASNDVGAVIAIESWRPEQNVEVSDLTVDCNHTPTNPNFANAVALHGARHAIRRVKAVNASGGYNGFENFVIHISGWSFPRPSEGNVIEDCEVSGFKGSYGIGIALGGGARYQTGGIVRGNKVYDFRSRNPVNALNAYGGAALKNAIFENNYAYRCDSAVNFDTARSINVTFRGNQFIGCRLRGIGLLGQQMDTLIVENNFIEMDPNTRDYAIVCWDSGGVTKLRNYSIRNNTVRALEGRSGLAGGIYVWVENAESFSISGNRIDSGLRNVITAPGVACFDNTDLLGRPINLHPASQSSQIHLPTGEGGTLLLNRGNAHIVVETTPNSVSNGVNLAAAYARARAMRPRNQALSSTNRATVFLFPGTYTLAGPLILDTPFVDLVGLGNNRAIRLESEGDVLVQTADDVTIENLTVHCSSTMPLTYSAVDKAAYAPASNLARTVVKNCIFNGSNNGLSMRLGVDYAGYYENCHAGPLSFGAGRFFGNARNCSAGHDSFGGSGVLIDCEVHGSINSSVPLAGKLIDCRVGPAPANASTIVLGNGASLYNCTVIASPAGSGYSIDAVGLVQARIAHCRFNRGIRNVVNVVADPANVEDPDLD
jgi:hypothetical protein